MTNASIAGASAENPRALPFLTSGRILSALIAVGIALRLWQYLADMSMWFDEFSIARNIGERSFEQLLTKPLAFEQTAPLGFLAAVDIAKHLFGASDMSLRLFPFLCGIASLFVFRRLAERALVGIAVPFAVALFALSAPLIRYSAELKQYSGDVLVTSLLTLVALDLCTRQPSRRRSIAAGAIGVVSILFSQAAVLVMTGLGAALFARWLFDRSAKTREPVIVTVPIWACAAIGGLLTARHYMTAHTMAFMHEFWRSRQGFLPLPPSSSATMLWTRDRVLQFFDQLSGYPIPALYTLLALAGFAVLWRRRHVALILAGPFLVTFAAAVAQQYPFRMRVVLFLLPTLLLTAAASIGWVVDRVMAISPAAGIASSIALLVPPAIAIVLSPPPYVVEPFKPVLAYVQSHLQPGDRVYVFANAYMAVSRYGPRYGMPLGSYVPGTCDDSAFTPFYADVDRFRGAPRVWIVGSSVPNFRPARSAIGKYLRTIGIKRDSVVMKSAAPMDPVSAELYDLSDTTRLRAATAATFHVEPDPVLHALCYDWVRPTQPAASALLR